MMTKTKLKQRFSTVVMLCVVTALVGCAVPAQKRAESFSEAGLTYVQAARLVNEISLEESLMFSAELLPSLPRTSEVLSTQSDQARERVRLLALQRQQLDLLERYFGSLGALAKGSASSKAEKALADLIYGLKGTLDVTRKSSQDFAALTTDWSGGVTLQAIARRDAPIIEAVLVAMGEALAQQADWLMFRTELARKASFLQDIEKPFLNNSKLSVKWKKAWISSVKPPKTEETLVKAQVATQALLEAWKELTLGGADTRELGLLLKQLNRSLAKLEKNQ